MTIELPELLKHFEPVPFVNVGMNVWATTVINGQSCWVHCKVTMAAGYHARVWTPHHGGIDLLRHVDDLRQLPEDIQRQLRKPAN